MSEQQATADQQGTSEADAAAAAAATADQTGDGKDTAANGADKGAGANGAAGGEQTADTTADKSKGKTLAQGGETDGAKSEDTPPPAWPEDWRKRMAEHYAAGDKKAYDRELKRLARVADPTSLFGSFRELEAWRDQGGFIKKPGKEATPEEVAEFHKSMGVPEKAEDYLKDLKLENGAVIGDADKPMLESFAHAAHEAGMPPGAFEKAANWYFARQEEQAAALDEADEKFKQEAERELKNELGAAFQRKINAIGSLFTVAPGGTNLDNEGSLYARLMGGRMADGKLIGNDPDMTRFLLALASDIHPGAMVSNVEDGDQSGKSVEAEIKEIETAMKSDRRAYFKDEAKQARYRELLEARDKIQARQRA